MALFVAGKSAGKTGGGFAAGVRVVEVEIFGAGVDMGERSGGSHCFAQQHP
jgi:hypothetical protein